MGLMSMASDVADWNVVFPPNVVMSAYVGVGSAAEDISTVVFAEKPIPTIVAWYRVPRWVLGGVRLVMMILDGVVQLSTWPSQSLSFPSVQSSLVGVTSPRQVSQAHCLLQNCTPP